MSVESRAREAMTELREEVVRELICVELEGTEVGAPKSFVPCVFKLGRATVASTHEIKRGFNMRVTT